MTRALSAPSIYDHHQLRNWPGKLPRFLLLCCLTVSSAHAQPSEPPEEESPPTSDRSTPEADPSTPAADTEESPNEVPSPPEKPSTGAASPAQISPPKPQETIVPNLDELQDLPVGEQVILRLTIGENGNVDQALLERGVREDVDTLVLGAARDFRFTPAKRDGTPLRATILFAYPIPQATDEAEPAPEEPALAPVASVDGNPSEAVAPSPPPVTAQSTPSVATAPDAKAARAAESQAADSSSTADETIPQKSVTVTGRRAGSSLRRSAYAVEVIELEDAHQQAGDLGEVIGRSNAVTVRRTGGFGSQAGFSMGGLGGDRVRFFIDGVPVMYAGYPFGAANIPVNLVDRVELYNGVVPIRFGTDSLGGVVALVTDQSTRSNKGHLSYQVSSFNTHRVLASAQRAFPEQKAFARVTGYLDSTDNDYPVDVEVLDAQGRPSPATLRRFHDGYKSYGATATGGITGRSWADRLIVTGFVSGFAKEIQNDPAMVVPYGEVTFDRQSAGGNLRWRASPTEDVSLEVLGGYAYLHSAFQDISNCRYNWQGECFLELPVRGEINQIPRDTSVHDNQGFVRLRGDWNIGAKDVLRASVAPDWGLRRGDDAELSGDEYDSLNEPQGVTAAVLGLEWQRDLFEGAFSNVLFFKSYHQRAYADQELGTGEVAHQVQKAFKVGGGESLRYFLLEDLYLKTSYEYAIRLPELDEYFGDASLVVANLALLPESSHNLNLGLFSDDFKSQAGLFDASLNGLARFSSNLIRLAYAGSYLQYNNVPLTHGYGIEARLAWTSPKDIVALGSQASWLDLRNKSKTGDQAAFEGDRIPNKPYLRATGHARFRLHALTQPEDYVDLIWRYRYVHSFFRDWESAGNANQKLTIDTQFSQDLALSYFTSGFDRRLSATLEAQNFTNATLSDFYGVQRPGRSFHFKFTFDI